MAEIKSVKEIIDILSRDTIDGSAVEKTLVNAAVTNYHTLYDIQTDLVGLKRFDVPIQELEIIHKASVGEQRKHYPHRYAYHIPYTVISTNSRKACKRYGYYGKVVSQEEISKDKAAFSFNFLIFIDGHFIDTGELFISDNESMFIIDVADGDDTLNTDGIPFKQFEEYLERNVIVTFMFIPNYSFDKLEINYPTLNNVLNRKIPYSRFDNLTSIDTEKSFVFMNKDGHFSTKDCTICAIDNDSKTLSVPSDLEFSVKRTQFSIITLNDLYDKIIINPGDSDIFQLPDNYKMPLPISNMIVFRKINGNQYIFDKDITFKIYYPNFYKIENWDNTSELCIYVLYQETNDSKYINELSALELLSGNLVDRYRDGSLPDFVTEYEPLDNKWLISGEEFVNSVFFPNKTYYNISVLSEIVLRNPHFLVEYLYLKLKSSPKYFINVNKLNLNDRVRTDTLQECQESGDLLIFDNPCYIFSIRKQFVGSFGTDFRVFIDNKLVQPLEYTLVRGDDFYHFYIPTNMVNEDSIIELEKHSEYQWSKDIQITNVDEYITVALPKNISKIYAHDIALVNSETGTFIGTRHYNIMAYSDIAKDYIDINPAHFAVISKDFKIKLNDTDYIDKPLKISIHHRMATKSIDTTKDDLSELCIHTPFANLSNVDDANIRVFAGGLLLPSELYSVVSNGLYNAKIDVDIFLDIDKDPDKYKFLTVDALPVPRRLVYYKKTIDNEYGFVNTGESLALPLDLKWYDIYLNGKRLNKNNLDIVTSNKFFVKNVESLKNLYIYEHLDIYDEFDFIHEESMENKLFNNIDDIYNSLLEGREIIPDLEDDIASDLLVNITNHIQFVRDILEYTFINANEQQITPEIQALYPDLIDEYGILWLDTNENPDAARITYINSNVRYDFMKRDQYRYGWSPLHIGSHDDAKAGEYLCDPITGAPGMKNADGTIIPIGELDRLSIHKTNFQNTMIGNGLSSYDIYEMQFDENTASRDITNSSNILDEEVVINEPIKNMVLSLDIQVLKRGFNDVMTFSSYVPNVRVTYTVNDETKTISTPYIDLATSIISINSENGVTINSIKLLPSDPDEIEITGVKCVLHSILIAC